MKINPKAIQKGDVLLVDFPFNDSTGFKRRPAVVTDISRNNNIFITKITSQIKTHPYNIDIQNLSSAGLRKQSQVQCNREIIINRFSSQLITKLGHLDNQDLANVLQNIQNIRNEKYKQHSIQNYCNKYAQQTHQPLNRGDKSKDHTR